MSEQSILPNENDQEKITTQVYESFDQLIESGSMVETGGKQYFYLPYWFERVPGGSGWNVHHFDDLPKDLIDFIVKSRLGGDNPRPDQSLIYYPIKHEG